MAHQQPTIKTGTVLAGTYRVTQLVNGGGIGAIYRAENLKNPTLKLAVKVFAPVANNQKYAHRRFQEEVELVAALDNAHIARVYTVGITADDQPYLVMDYLEGHDLAGALNRMDKIPVKRVGDIMTQMGNALKQAHAQGIIHRDIRPGNIIVGMADHRTTAAKLINFGSSRLRWSGADSREILARHPDPDFVPPELVTGRVVDLGPSADVFSLAATAYYALSGMLPFSGQPLPDSGARTAATPVHERVPSLSSRVSEVLARGMANRPVDRYPRISEFVARLVTALGSRADEELQWPDDARRPEPSPGQGVEQPAGAGLQEVATAAVPSHVQEALLARQQEADNGGSHEADSGGLQEVATAALPSEIQESLLAKQREADEGLQEVATAAVSSEFQQKLLGRQNSGGGLHEVPTVTLEEKLLNALGGDDESGGGWSDELSAAVLGGDEVFDQPDSDSGPKLNSGEDSGTLEAAWQSEPEEDPTADELIFGNELPSLRQNQIQATDFDDDDPTVLDKNPPQAARDTRPDQPAPDLTGPDAKAPDAGEAAPAAEGADEPAAAPMLEVVETGEAALGLGGEVVDLAGWDDPVPAAQPSEREGSEPHAQLVVSSEITDNAPQKDAPGLLKTTSGELKTAETLSRARQAVAEADAPSVEVADEPASHEPDAPTTRWPSPRTCRSTT